MTKLNRIDPASLANNPRATYNAWRKYEPIVVAAFRKFPEPFYWSPSIHGISCVTVVSRIRDAIRGKIAFDYPSELSDEDIADWFSKVMFKVVRNTVFIGTKDAISVVAPLSVQEERRGDLVFETLTQPELVAFAYLLSQGRLSGPIIVRSPDASLSTPDYPNFHILQRPDGSLVLL